MESHFKDFIISPISLQCIRSAIKDRNLQGGERRKNKENRKLTENIPHLYTIS